MIRQTISLILVILLSQVLFVIPATAETKEEKIHKHSAKVKAAIAKLGVGANARAEVKLRDKTKIKGYIRDAEEDRFVIVDASTGVAATVAYASVKQIKGNNLSTGAKILIWLGIVAGIILFISLGVDD